MIARLFLVFCMLYSTQAFAIFDIQAYVGKRSGDFNNGSTEEALEGLNYGAAFYFSPIPFVPVALGVAAEYLTYDDMGDFSDVSGYLVIPQVSAWLPIGLLSLKPFVKLGYALGAVTGEGKVQGVSVKGAYKTTGVHATLGVKWKPPVIPFVAFFAQYDYAQDTSSVVSLKVDGDKVTPAFDDDEDFKNTAFHIGVEVGI